MPGTERRKCEVDGKNWAVKGSTRCRWHGGKQARFRETPPDGIRHTHEVTFTSDEAKRVRAAASQSGTTVCQYLHDLALHDGERAEPQVNIHVEGNVLTEGKLRGLVEAELQHLGRRGPFGRM